MIKTMVHSYLNASHLNIFLLEHRYVQPEKMFIQVFGSYKDIKQLEEIQTIVNDYFSQVAMVAVASHNNNIVNGTIIEDEIKVILTIFENTIVRSIGISNKENTSLRKMGEIVCNQIVEEETKAIILLTIGTEMNSEQLLQPFSGRMNPLSIVGGSVKNDTNSKDNLVYLNKELISEGIIGISFSGESLVANSYNTFELDTLGPEFIVTQSKDYVVHEIENKKAEVYFKNLLDMDALESINSSIFHFPMLLKNNKDGGPAFITKVNMDGSIEFNRKIEAGTKLVMTVPAYHKVADKAVNNLQGIIEMNAEVLFTYNCLSKNKIIPEFFRRYLEDMESLAPTLGQMTHGEIIQTKRGSSHLVGMAFTSLGLSETSKIKSDVQDIRHFKYETPVVFGVVQSLVKIITMYEKLAKFVVNKEKRHRNINQILFNKTDDIIFSFNTEEVLTTMNPGSLTYFQREKMDLIGSNLSEILTKEHYSQMKKYIQLALQGHEQYYQINLDIKGKSNEFIVQQIPVYEDGNIVEIQSIARNITELKYYESQINSLSNFDLVTGLPNRMKFVKELDYYLEEAVANRTEVALIAIDIDRFKLVNDTFGHQTGDNILKELSKRVESKLNSNFIISRFSEDKFFILPLVFLKEKELLEITREILDEIALPIYVEEKELFITASAGVSLFPQDGSNSNYLIKNADIAIDMAKYHGGNQVKLFASTMNQNSINRLELESALHMALSRNEFELLYQPILNVKTHQIVAAEALIRWNSRMFGYVMPSDFIPIAEETGMINSIGKWVILEACKQAKVWHDQGYEYMGISVNVSAKQFQQVTFISHIESALEKTGLSSSKLTLELTETTTLEDIQYSIHTIKKLQEIGVKVSIDDFGTGYSSLSYMKNLPVDTIKLDRSFIMQLTRDSADYAIVQAIITLTKGLKVKIVAEGVEKEEQLQLLRELECDFAQGYYISKPASKEDLVLLIQNNIKKGRD